MKKKTTKDCYCSRLVMLLWKRRRRRRRTPRLLLSPTVLSSPLSQCQLLVFSLSLSLSLPLFFNAKKRYSFLYTTNPVYYYVTRDRDRKVDCQRHNDKRMEIMRLLCLADKKSKTRTRGNKIRRHPSTSQRDLLPVLLLLYSTKSDALPGDGPPPPRRRRRSGP